MIRKPISLLALNARVHHLWHKQWFLLTSGDFEKQDFNTMTVGWGSLGTMWSKPFVQVFVRPTRYTFEFMERYDGFTLSAFSADHRKALSLLGTKSGRDGDKIKEAGLNPITSAQVTAPGFAEAVLILECKKMYWDDLDPSRFLDTGIDRHYSEQDYHRIYFGEVVAAFGTSAFSPEGVLQGID